jgi:hypothetical protein
MLVPASSIPVRRAGAVLCALSSAGRSAVAQDQRIALEGPSHHITHRLRHFHRHPSVAGAPMIIIQPVEPRSDANISGAFSRSACSAAWQPPGTVIGAMLLGILRALRRRSMARRGRREGAGALLTRVSPCRPARTIRIAAQRNVFSCWSLVVAATVFFGARLVGNDTCSLPAIRVAIHRAGDGLEHPRDIPVM